uniref:Reverse transcriptase domain-containing protein n=1 Tax=Haemonchus contortus TaxID=6289 RepID=A0A7I4YRI3_HAECO
MRVQGDSRYLHHFRFADDIVLITPNIEQAEQMLAEFDNACGKIGLRLNLKKTMFMQNGLLPYAPFALNGRNIFECSSYVYLEQRGIRSFELRRRTKITDAIECAKKSKMRWARLIMRYSDDRWTSAVTDWIPWDVKRTPRRPPTT